MNRIEKLLKDARKSPQNMRFSDIEKICDHFFGEPRNKGTSHYIYRTPWQGDPRINIQKGHDGKAKTYQVKQVLTAIDKLKKSEDNG